MFWRSEVRVRAIGALACQLQHFWTKRGQYAMQWSGWLGSHEHSLVHDVQIFDHCRIWLYVISFVQRLHHVAVACANAQEETIGKSRRERFLTSLHGGSSACIHGSNARSHNELLCCRQQNSGVCKWFAANGFGNPHSFKTQLFKFLHCFTRLGHWLAI